MAVGRFSVPLNTICSRKWASPFVRPSSARDPAPTNTLTLTDCAVGTGVVTTRRPPSSSLISGVMVMGSSASIAGRRPRDETVRAATGAGRAYGAGVGLERVAGDLGRLYPGRVAARPVVERVVIVVGEGVEAGEALDGARPA